MSVALIAVSPLTLAKWIPRKLGIPRNSKQFQVMQIRIKPTAWNFLEYLGMFTYPVGNNLEFLGIPKNSKTKQKSHLELLGMSGNQW